MDGNQKKIRNLLLYIGIPVVVLFIIIFLFNNRTPQQATYKYSDIIDYFQTQQVSKYQLNLGTGEMAITLEDGKTIGYVLPSVDLFYMDVKEDIDQYNEDHPDSKMVQDILRPAETSWFISLLPTLILFVGLIIFWVIMMRRLGSSMGGDKQMNFGKAKIKQMSDEKRKTTFADVAGADEEKEELREIVEFLKNPNKYNSLGARIPKGVLLVGPPGTGKTLLARAVAGEAGVPFFSISGSDFVEMFVGVGASRVRDLFDKAKKNHPCIIFIDEIDAVGRQRGAGLGGGHDEREQTLNQLLVEMDGFGANEGVIMIAATNRPDILDPALMRPGRFDRQVMVGYPDIKGHQISIIPRGMAGGYTMHLPTEDRTYQSRDEMREELVVLLGGRVAEALVLDDISTGASNDIERATKIARAMVTKYGMSDKLGPITYGTDDSNPFLGKEMGHISNYSERTASEIDEEIQAIISTAYAKTEKILKDHMDELHRLAGVLFEKEKVDGVEFQQVMDGNLLPSGMTQQTLGQEPQAGLPQEGQASSQEDPAGSQEQD